MSETGESVRGEQPRGRSIWIIVAIAVVLGLVAGFLGGLLGRNVGNTAPIAASTTSAVAPGGTSCNATKVSADVLPAVVTISASNGSDGGVGTGEIVRKDGYIVTNNHVISVAANGGSIEVLYSSGESDSATLVGRDPRADLAVLKVKHSGSLPTIGVGSSASVKVGQPVVALGAPLGLSGTVTSGIVSALGRDVTVPGDDGQSAILADAVQTDAAINPGNSGGPLVDCNGNLIGINSAIATVPNESGQAGGGSVGIGFAVPVDRAMTIVNQIISTGKAVYPYFGVSVAAISENVASDYGVDTGLYVASTVSGGPAAKAGLKQGDIIVTVDGQPATTVDDLTAVTLKKKAGDTVDIGYVRDGKKATTKVTLQEAPTSS